MEKRKEKADLEQLLNSLIEKGWKPRGSEEWKWIPYTFNALKNNKKSQYQFLRNLTSKESGVLNDFIIPLLIWLFQLFVIILWIVYIVSFIIWLFS